MKIDTTRFGELDVNDNDLISLPDGLFGLGAAKYALLVPENNSDSVWLQSIDRPEVALIITTSLAT